MHTASIPTKTLAGFDYRVWFAVLFTWLLCLGFWSYRKINNPAIQSCTGMGLQVNGQPADDANTVYLNEATTLNIAGAGNARITWDFGDGAGTTTGSTAWHKYTAEKTYTIVARVNGVCELKTVLQVKARESTALKPWRLDIVPDSTHGKPGARIRFSAVPDGFAIQSYEWTVLGTNQRQTGAVATFDFLTASKYTVQLVANHDPVRMKQIDVEITDVPAPLPPVPANMPVPEISNLPQLVPGSQPPKSTANPATEGAKENPPAPPPAAPKATQIDPDMFKALLQKVLKGEESIDVLFQYLDYKDTTQVDVNDKDSMTLKEFCNKKRGKKIDSLSFVRDDKQGVQRIKVKLKRGGIFGVLG